MAGVFFIVVALIAYGAYLNHRSENQITERLAEQRVPLLGEAACYRELYPSFNLEAVRFATKEVSDAVALVDGKIMDVLVKKNDYVHAGQVLCVLNAPELATRIKQADSGIQKAEAELAHARNTYSRYERLRAKDATSAEKFDEAETNYRAAQTALSAAIAQKEELLVQVDQQEVRSPIDGEILIIYRPQGAYVSSGSSVALIGDFQKLSFSVPIDALTAEHLAMGREAKVQFSHEGFDKIYDTEYAAGNLGKGQEFIARIVEITPDFSEPAAMRRVVWEVDNSAGLLEQKTYTDVVLASTTPRHALTVPLISMTDSSHTAVFVFKEDGTLERRQVKAGLSDGQFIEILSGLREGETVVTSDPKGLTEGMQVRLVPASEAGGSTDVR